MKKLAASLLALGLVAGMQTASACVLSAWGGTAGTGQVAGGPGGADSDTTTGSVSDPDVFARYSGTCAMEASAAGQFVGDNSPNDAEAEFHVRFYFRPEASGTADLLTAYTADDGGGSEVFTVSYDGTNVVVTPSSGASASAVAAAAGSWSSVELAWNQNGNISLWVNADATTDPASDATGSDSSGSAIGSVRFGTMSNSGITVQLDDYESRRTTAIGTLLPGDANADSALNIFDIIAMINEIVNGTLANGSPDFTEDGQVNIFDIINAINAIVNP